MNPRHVRLVARREITDYRRQARVWLALIGGPLLLTAVIAFPAVLGRNRDRVTAATKFSVAVQGDRAGAAALLHSLRQSHFVVHPSGDAAASILKQDALTGLVLPKAVDASVVARHRVTLTVLDLTNGGKSIVAAKVLVETLRAMGVRVTTADLIARGADPELLAPLRVDVTDLAGGSPSGVRDTLGLGLSLLLALQCLGLMGLAQERIGGSRDRRVLEPILALPIGRRDLLMGAGLASLAAGLAAVVLALGPVSGFVAIAVHSVRDAPGGLVALFGGMGVGVIALATVLIAAGLLIGTMAESSLTGTTTTNAIRLALYIGIAIIPIFDLPTTPWFLALPLVGPISFVRDAIGHGLLADRALIVVVAALAWSFLFITRAARLLDAERGVLRSGGRR